MSQPTFDRDFWERLWSQTVSGRATDLARKPANTHLVAEAASLKPGHALDAGCGHGIEALWLAARGWRVTAVDFSKSALAYGKSMSEAAGADMAGRIDWLEANISDWTPEQDHYDLVVCLYVHVSGSVERFVRQMGKAVAPGGTLLMVGHRPFDPSSGSATAAANQLQVSVEAATAALDPAEWELVVAEERPRSIAGTGVDAVIRATKRVAQSEAQPDVPASGGFVG